MWPRQELTGGEVHLSGGGDGQRVLDPGRGVDRHAPVAPRPDLRVLGGHLSKIKGPVSRGGGGHLGDAFRRRRYLDDVLLPGVGVGDGVGGAVRQLHLQEAERTAALTNGR